MKKDLMVWIATIMESVLANPISVETNAINAKKGTSTFLIVINVMTTTMAIQIANHVLAILKDLKI